MQLRAALKTIVKRERLPQGPPRRSTGHRAIVSWTWPHPQVQLTLKCGHVVECAADRAPKYAVRCKQCAEEA